MDPNIIFHDITHGWSKGQWKHAYDRMKRLCAETGQGTLFIFEEDNHSKYFEQIYKTLVPNQNDIDKWPIQAQTCDNVYLQRFEPITAWDMYKSDKLFSYLVVMYNKQPYPNPDPNMIEHLKQLFDCDVSPDMLLTNSLLFLNNCKYSFLPDYVHSKVLELGASENEYQSLLKVMCKCTFDEILSSNYLPNSYHGVAFIGQRHISIPFNLLRGLWNVHAARTAYNAIHSGMNVILINGRMHNYCIKKMIGELYMGDGLPLCATFQESLLSMLSGGACNIM